ncbi:hypothetical protein [Zunongwangia sp.]|uniref:hypothetical protein n=1 Tax=Zunongwangia sp. TaxID=1965325 RepID=UPI003AA9A728
MDAKQNNWQGELKKNTKDLAIWTFLWVFTLAFVAFGPKFIWNENKTITIVMIIVNTFVGVGMILINRKQLISQDPLQRKITMDAMAITLGITLVLGISYSMLDITNLITFNAEISHLVLIMGITYLIAMLIGNARYK